MKYYKIKMSQAKSEKETELLGVVEYLLSIINLMGGGNYIGDALEKLEDAEIAYEEEILL